MKIEKFSIPVYTNLCDLNTSLFSTNLETEELHINDEKSNYGSRSVNTHILDLEKYSILKNWIDREIERYTKEILGWKFKKVSITQSWISVKKFRDKHLLHKHPNSLISGVFYWQDNVESMYLKRPPLPQNFEIEITTFNEFSKDWIEIIPQKGLLCLFPSYLEHFVSENQTTQDRYCLPFNTMIFEKLGFEENLTGLDLSKQEN